MDSQARPPASAATRPASDAAADLCGNCLALLSGAFCAACGQEARHSARSMRTLLHEVFEGLTNLDGRAWRTVRALLFRPGLLTAEYLADRRVRYLPPFRLYLVVSVLFFALGVDDGSRGSDEDTGRAARTSEERLERQQACREDLDLTWAGEPVRQVALNACLRAAGTDDGKLTRVFAETLPRTMFLFLPVTALTLLGLFGRARRYYVEHLVFTLHLQSAAFLVLLACTLVDRAFTNALAPLETGLITGLLAYLVFYTYRALRVAYGQSRPRTLFKLAVFGTSSGILLLITLLGTAVFSALQG
jgi:hypothetical protein